MLSIFCCWVGFCMFIDPMGQGNLLDPEGGGLLGPNPADLAPGAEPPGPEGK